MRVGYDFMVRQVIRYTKKRADVQEDDDDNAVTDWSTKSS